MKAVTELRKTGWYLIIDEDGTHYTDDEGHMWFSKDIARDLGRQFRVMALSSSGGLREVVTNYTEA
jgi:hypothetical protein